MDGRAVPGADNRTFKVDFSADSETRLREALAEKLKEFMGDYTDETLVGYIVVLLRNGRNKDQANDLLNAFLGDDTAAFVSWLWDHLSTNMHLYMHPTDVDNEQEKPIKDIKRQQIKESKGFAREENKFPLRSVVSEILHSDEKPHHRSNVDRPSSPHSRADRKRSRDERQTAKRSLASHSVIDAPRRLLQFAVRDAVRTVNQPNSRSEPALKRLRSVVSTSTTDSLQEKGSERLVLGSRMPGALSTALRAVAEAAADVNMVRSSGSVFDRLTRVRNTTEPTNWSSDARSHEMENVLFENHNQITSSDFVNHHNRNEYDVQSPKNFSMFDEEPEMTDSGSENDVCDDVNIVTLNGSAAPQSIPFAVKDNESVMMENSAALEPHETVSKRRLVDQDQPARSAGMASSKIVNISVNVNTWKPSHYEVSRDVSEVENRSAVEEGEAGAGKPNVVLKENIASLSQHGQDMEHVDVANASQKPATATTGAYSAGRPLEDFDSRTLFVSNVHFAATKDALSRHFNKFGNVLKVVIITDVATGQPTGSAYVEFLKKESADLALSLNGTSFMSRILKVVRRSSQEVVPMLGWPRVARPASFSSGLGRIPYPRGVLPGSFRARLPVKPGARSLQWKREASTAGPSQTSGINVASPTARSLTYTRNDSKIVGNSEAA